MFKAPGMGSPVVSGPKSDGGKLIFLSVLLVVMLGFFFWMRYISEHPPEKTPPEGVAPSESGEPHADRPGTRPKLVPPNEDLHESDPIRSRLSRIEPGEARMPADDYYVALKHVRDLTSEEASERAVTVKPADLFKDPFKYQGTWVRIVVEPVGTRSGNQFRTVELIGAGTELGKIPVHVMWATVAGVNDEWEMVVADSLNPAPKVDADKFLAERYEVEGLFFKIYDYQTQKGDRRDALELIVKNYKSLGVPKTEGANFHMVFLVLFVVAAGALFLRFMIQRNSGPERSYQETLAEMRKRRKERATSVMEAVNPDTETSPEDASKPVE